MTKRLVEIDDGDLRMAQEILGAATIRETVARALKDVIAAEAGRQYIEMLRDGHLSLMADKEERRRAWGQ
ncbi:MAG TPA: type II toxin-antitoxin system VapB family antitoxin [Terrimesophilobacter sp.]|nr:type II toxin-antitoxin system VapB family antitoxin [Terrimesophilobacter sp.]HRP99555.1 type II toxin-antitoxin system VapB family antitoxin [Terrimesophilobacter sp.]